MRYMEEILNNNKKWVIVYLVIGVFNAFMLNFKAGYFQKIVDGLTERTISAYGILIYGVVLIVVYGMNYADEYPKAKLENKIYLDFKLLALQKISRIDYCEYQRLGCGRLVQRIENGANAGKGVLYDFWFCVVRNLLPTVLFSLWFIGKIDRKITCFLITGYIVVFIAANLLLRGLYQIKEKILTNEEDLNHFLVRGFMEMPLFRMKRQFPDEIKKAVNARRIIVSSKVKMTMIHEAFFVLFAMLVACLDIGILIYGWKNSRLSVGEVVALITLLDNAYMPIAIFNVIYVQYKLNKTAWRRFTDLLDLKEDAQLRAGVAFAGFANEVRVKNLSFSYESKSVLHHISISMKKGEKVAFVGESGSGKSTLAKLLVGLLKYERGNIFFDDKPLKEFSLESFYEKVSYLSQDTPVFDGTIRENLVFDQDVEESVIWESLEKAQLLPMVATLDKGLETKIGEKGACLSGGEKQRLALARLLFSPSELVVLDEATSALDNLTESMVIKNIMEQMENATILVIAHHLAAVSGFDRIIVFRNGKVTGNGTFEELLENNGYFRELYRKEKEKISSEYGAV
ncbi:MAG: ABC transporter ATP-binding protein/permease [Bacteroidales bacterium]|nr:ABC transporter ATP-binding protein/permease [Clostridium sp.]MCM1203581.1 ABC transporter ATP-binding protein/permease [Bacteroidales bacterium]